MSSNDQTRNQPWSGRFAEPATELVQRFTASVSFDRRLAAFDIEASIAHARMLHAVGIIGKTDLAAIEKGLAQIRSEVSIDAVPTRAGCPRFTQSRSSWERQAHA